jgi:uncharacterized protein YrzB (UPF0473 family)
MSNYQFGEDLMTLIDEYGNEHEFELLDVIKNQDGVFYAMTPTFPNEQDQLDEESTYYIFESVDVNGEEQLAEVEDDDLLERLAVAFESKFAEFD